MFRRFAPAGIAIALVATLGLAVSAESDPGTGVQVPTLAEHNALVAEHDALEAEHDALEQVVTDLDARVAALEAEPEPEPEPTEEPDPTEEPTPDPGTPPAAGDFPTANDVGPATEPTEVYGGSCTITQNDLLIEDRIINCQDGLVVDATGVVIRNSVINGGVYTAFREQSAPADDNTHPTVFTVESSRIVSGPAVDYDGRALGWAHFVVRDSYIQGEHSGAFAYNDVVLEGNFITTSGNDTHQSGLRMLKNSTLRGNTIMCNPASPGSDGGCSGHAVFYPEFGVTKNLTIEGNFFKRHPDGGPWFAARFIDCNARDDCTGLTFTGNLFSLGNGTSAGEFPDEGVWENNWWVDGAPAGPDEVR